MDRSALLFGLSGSAIEVLGCILDLSRADGLVYLGERDLDFFEAFSGAAKLSNEMEEVLRMNGKLCISMFV